MSYKELSLPFRVLCVDNGDKPMVLTDEEWINKNEEYIVTDIFKDLITDNVSFKLLDKNPDPYKGYRADRFMIAVTGFSVN
jgi:hypothetical protein